MGIPSYQAVVTCGDWLEDRKKGKYARYLVGEETIWVCHDCESVHVDPYESNCDCFQEEEE